MTAKTSLSALNDMTLFVEVARALSFSDASRHLGMPVATISRRIAAFEKAIGVCLFNRTTRKVELTETGRRHFERCALIAEDARLAQADLEEHTRQPKGMLRIAMPVDLGVHVVAPWLVDFARRYPEITFDVDLSSHRLDLPMEQSELVLQLGPPTDDKLIARAIGALELGLFAAPSYLQAHGHPAHPAALVEHHCITRHRPQGKVELHFDRRTGQGSGGVSEHASERERERATVQVGGRFVANSQGLIRQLAESGMGIGVMPKILAGDAVRAGRLEAVLADWAMPRLPVHAVMASRSQPLRVRLLLEFLHERMAVL